MQPSWGWRGACLGWAALHLVLALPLYAAVPRRLPYSHAPPGWPGTLGRHTARPYLDDAPTDGIGATWPLLLALLFTLMGFVSTAWPRTCRPCCRPAACRWPRPWAWRRWPGRHRWRRGCSSHAVLRRFSPLLSARLATLGHPLGAVLLLVLGPAAAVPFVLIHGLGNGLLTIVRGTLPLALFGSARLRCAAGLDRAARAHRRCAFALAVRPGARRWGVGALWLSAGVGLAAHSAGVLIALRLPGH
jgi:hypothetical protein